MTTPHKTSSAPTQDTVLDLKQPWLAALLSWAIPGAGQLYQRRYFKGVLFLVCILGMFLSGLVLGEGRPVYSYYYVVTEGQMLKKRNYGFLSQMLVGLSAMPALVQASRFESLENTRDLEKPIEAPFQGRLQSGRDDSDALSLTGQLSLQSVAGPTGPTIQGRLVGNLQESGENVDLELEQYSSQEDAFPISYEISADPERSVLLRVTQVVAGPENMGETLVGFVPRPFWNWFQVPLQDHELQDLNARLGKRWELAMVLTWIAGLLNILAIWDAYEGPAYGIRPTPRKPSEPDKPPVA